MRERERAKQSKNNGSTVFVRKIHLGKQHLIMQNCYECLSLFKVYKYCLVVTQGKKDVILWTLVNFCASSRGKLNTYVGLVDYKLQNKLDFMSLLVILKKCMYVLNAIYFPVVFVF